MPKKIYLAGSLKNWDIVKLANNLALMGMNVFADWITPGPEADDYLRKYAAIRGWNYKQTLRSDAASHVFEFDKKHIDESDIFVLVMPAGKSAHMELGYASHAGKLTYVLFDVEPARVDIMYNFATEVFFNQQDLFEELKNYL